MTPGLVSVCWYVVKPPELTVQREGSKMVLASVLLVE